MKTTRYIRRDTYRLILDALFAALYLVLAAFVSVRTPFAKISFSSLPLLLAAYLFGPVDALLVATVGAFLEQVKFGLGPTAPLWLLPAMSIAATAGVLGLLARRSSRYYNLLVPVTLIAEIVFTATNTAALYLDGYLMGYSVKALTVLLPPRLANLGVRAVITTVTVRLLLPRVQKLMSKRNDS